jgi:hypothetical protein
VQICIGHNLKTGPNDWKILCWANLLWKRTRTVTLYVMCPLFIILWMKGTRQCRSWSGCSWPPPPRTFTLLPPARRFVLLLELRSCVGESWQIHCICYEHEHSQKFKSERKGSCTLHWYLELKIKMDVTDFSRSFLYLLEQSGYIVWIYIRVFD